jgi:hypothetical protein
MTTFPVMGWSGFWRVLCSRHFSINKTYVNRESRTVVILNPKVGTKSFRLALTEGLRKSHGLADPSEGRYPYFKKAREFSVAPLRDFAHAFRHPAEYQFFCFVRNPYARLRSAWLNKFAYGHLQGYSRSIRRRELGRLRHYARRASLAGGAEGSAIPFETFLAYVESQSPGQRDHHWDDQCHVLLLDCVQYTQWFHMEGEFDTGMRAIFSRIGIAADVVEELLAIQKNVSPRDEAPLYTAELAARAYRIYARDFATFGYDQDSWRGR